MAGQDRKKAYLYASLTVLFWSTVASAFKIALADYRPAEVLLIANFVSLLIFSVLMLFRHKGGGATLFSGKVIWLSALQGLLNPFLYYLLLFRAYSLLPAQVAQPVNFVWPIMLMLLSVPLLRQKVGLRGMIALVVSFSGVLVLSTEGQIRHFSVPQPTGVALALLSSVIWALFWIINMKDKRNDVVKLFLSFFFSFLYMMILTLFTGFPDFSLSKSLLASVYTGIFETGITFLVWLKALRYSGSVARIANLVYLTPFLSLICIHFVLHEKLYVTTVAGLIMVVTGIVLQQSKKTQS